MSQNPKHPVVREVKLVGAEAVLYRRAQGALVSLHLELPWPPKQAQGYLWPKGTFIKGKAKQGNNSGEAGGVEQSAAPVCSWHTALKHLITGKT